jgi:Xaa-Pro aminopeptidase
MEDTRFAYVSNAELERRWALLRNLTSEKKLDCLLTSCNEDDHGGYIRWFTDNPVASVVLASPRANEDAKALYGYRKVAIFHANDLMTVVQHGPPDQKVAPGGKDPQNPGVGEIYGTASFPAVHYTLGYEAEIVVDVIKERGYRRVGLVGVGNFHYRFMKTLSDGLSGTVTFSDETEAVDWMMTVKSDEELDIIRRTAKLQDHLFATAVKNAKPGITDAALTGLVRAEAIRNGCAGGILLGGSGPQGSFASFRPITHQNRVIKEGDFLPLLVEVSGPGGYFTEVARTLSFGKVGSALAEANAAVTEMQHSIIRAFKPGTLCADVLAEHNRDRAARKLPPETRIFAHGQGYDLVERPLIREDETQKVAANMNLAVHPTIAHGNTVFTTMCDNFIVGADGSMERIHATEQKVFEI